MGPQTPARDPLLAQNIFLAGFLLSLLPKPAHFFKAVEHGPLGFIPLERHEKAAAAPLRALGAHFKILAPTMGPQIPTRDPLLGQKSLLIFCSSLLPRPAHFFKA